MTPIESNLMVKSYPINAAHLSNETYAKLMSDKLLQLLNENEIYVVRKDYIGIMLKFDTGSMYYPGLPTDLKDCIQFAANRQCNAVEILNLDKTELPLRPELNSIWPQDTEDNKNFNENKGDTTMSTNENTLAISPLERQKVSAIEIKSAQLPMELNDDDREKYKLSDIYVDANDNVIVIRLMSFRFIDEENKDFTQLPEAYKNLLRFLKDNEIELVYCETQDGSYSLFECEPDWFIDDARLPLHFWSDEGKLINMDVAAYKAVFDAHNAKVPIPPADRNE